MEKICIFHETKIEKYLLLVSFANTNNGGKYLLLVRFANTNNGKTVKKMKTHLYQAKVQWNGNEGSGTSDYRTYSRSHVISAPNKSAEILGSSDPAFHGDRTRYNPEDLLVASIAACHQLWYLHLCAVNKVVVVEYIDNAVGTMTEDENGSGRFSEVTLNPIVTVTEESMIDKANELHNEAHKMCFIANSCNFAIKHSPQTKFLSS